MAKIMDANNDSRLIEMGVFSVPHGIRGQVKLRSFTSNPDDITAYGPLQDSHGQTYSINITGQAGDMLIASVEGVMDRNAAERLKNITLFLPRSALPKPKKGEYYYEDLKGLEVVTKDGAQYGTILSIHDFGAGTLVNIGLAKGGEEFMPFSAAIFPEIDIEAGRAVIDPPAIVKGEASE